MIQGGLSAESQRIVIGRKAMIDKVSAIVGYAVMKEQSWHGMLEREVALGQKLYAYGPQENGWTIAQRLRGVGDEGF